MYVLKQLPTKTLIFFLIKTKLITLSFTFLLCYQNAFGIRKVFKQATQK